MNKVLCFALMVLLWSGAAMPARGFELQDILSAPYADELISAGDSERIAWVVYEAGVRNIWTAAAPSFEPHRLTAFEADDGQRVGGLAFTSDGSLLYFERGNAEGANPGSDPSHPVQTIHVINLASGDSWEVAKGGGVVLAPDDRHFLYQLDGKPMLAEVSASRPAADPEGEQEDGAGAKPEPLFRARGDLEAFTWSPDSRRIAFTSVRKDHSFIGVYDFEQKTISWIAPGVDFDSHPAWSPDGSQIAFFRTAGLKKDEMRSVVESRRVALWVADSARMTAEKIWEPGRDNGFFAQDYPHHPLRWSPDGRIVFYSEHDGWMHIYSVTAAGKDLQDLTPGACEAEHSALNADGNLLFFSANCDAGDSADIDRRHLWRVATDGGSPRAITMGRSIETDPVPVGSGKTVAFRDAGTRYPTAISVIGDKGGKPQRVFPKELPPAYPASGMIEPRQVVFHSGDGTPIHGQLFMPGNAAAGDRRPALIFMHGGPIRQMLLGYHYYGEYYAFAYAMNQYLANQGYVVLSVNYRAGIGYGRDFRLAENQGPRGASEYQDIIAAGKYLQSLASVDPRRIGLWGGSYGGLLTAMGLARNSDLFAAGVDLHGVHDWSWRGRDFGNGGWWSITEDLYPLALKSSPVSDLTYWTSPVLFIHGDDDRNVMFGQTVDLVQRLREKGLEPEVLIFPDEVHGFLRYDSWTRAYLATEDFFNRQLDWGQP